jgi:hypothetical protein
MVLSCYTLYLIDGCWVQAVEAATALASNGTTQRSTPAGMQSLTRKSDESVDTMSMSPHGTLWQLRYLGPLEDEQVEIGPLLGRGGFGRVYKGGAFSH